MDTDKTIKRIINMIKNDYLIDLDEDEEMGLTSDIADILQDKHNELTTLLIVMGNDRWKAKMADTEIECEEYKESEGKEE